MFGLGAAEIELKINKTSFSQGDTVEGTVTLKVLKPTKSNGVFVFVYTEQQFLHQGGGQGQNSTYTSSKRVDQAQIQLDGAREYAPTSEPLSYNFKIKLPGGQTESESDSSLVSKSLGFLSSLGSRPVGPPMWFVEARFEVPIGFATKTSLPITIV